MAGSEPNVTGVSVWLPELMARDRSQRWSDFLKIWSADSMLLFWAGCWGSWARVPFFHMVWLFSMCIAILLLLMGEKEAKEEGREGRKGSGREGGRKEGRKAIVQLPWCRLRFEHYMSRSNSLEATWWLFSGAPTLEPDSIIQSWSTMKTLQWDR